MWQMLVKENTLITVKGQKKPSEWMHGKMKNSFQIFFLTGTKGGGHV